MKRLVSELFNFCAKTKFLSRPKRFGREFFLTSIISKVRFFLNYFICII